MPETFLTQEVLEEVLNQYEWNCTIDIDDHSCSSWILLKFPKCSIIIKEGFESDMHAYFLNEELKIKKGMGSLQIGNAIIAIRLSKVLSVEEEELYKKIKNYTDPFASLEKVKDELNNIFLLLQIYLLPTLLKGDFGWIEEVKKEMPYYWE